MKSSVKSRTKQQVFNRPNSRIREVNFRISDEEEILLKKKAELAGTSVSNFVRTVVLANDSEGVYALGVLDEAERSVAAAQTWLEKMKETQEKSA